MKLSNLAPVEDTNELTANVHSVESFGNVDGPGIRYVTQDGPGVRLVVFLQ